jgi:hypothetical protein
MPRAKALKVRIEDLKVEMEALKSKTPSFNASDADKARETHNGCWRFDPDFVYAWLDKAGYDLVSDGTHILFRSDLGGFANSIYCIPCSNSPCKPCSE